MATPSLLPFKNPLTAVPHWHTVDATGHRVGRLATQIARVLMGKHKAVYNPTYNCGDNVVVYNAEKVVFTGRKWAFKLYRWHTGYPGGLKEVPAKFMFGKQPDSILRRAVNGMLPKNKLRKIRMKKLRIYVGEQHPHAGQVCPGTQHFFSKFEGKKQDSDDFFTVEDFDEEQRREWEKNPTITTGFDDFYKKKPREEIDEQGRAILKKRKGMLTPTFTHGTGARWRRMRRTERIRQIVDDLHQRDIQNKIKRKNLD